MFLLAQVAVNSPLSHFRSTRRATRRRHRSQHHFMSLLTASSFSDQQHLSSHTKVYHRRQRKSLSSSTECRPCFGAPISPALITSYPLDPPALSHRVKPPIDFTGSVLWREFDFGAISCSSFAVSGTGRVVMGSEGRSGGGNGCEVKAVRFWLGSQE
jgi:hypothetical protein